MDYLDGTLSQSQKQRVEEFLLLNPDIKDEIGSLDKIILTPEKQESIDLGRLKKHPEDNEGLPRDFDYLCIAKLENDITEEEESLLNNQLFTDKALLEDYEMIQSVKLKSNLNVTYQEKRHLKRYVIPVFSHLRAHHVAAVAVVLFLLFGLFSIHDTNHLVDYRPHPMAKVVELVPLGVPMAMPQVEPTRIVEAITRLSPLPFAKQERTEEEPITQPEVEPEITFNDIGLAVLYPVKPIPFTYKDLPPSTLQASLPPILLKESFNEGPIAPSGNIREIGPLELIQYGFKRLAQVTDLEVDIDGQRDEQGKLTRIRIESSMFALSLPIKKSN